jgi:hypothetical protein
MTTPPALPTALTLAEQIEWMRADTFHLERPANRPWYQYQRAILHSLESLADLQNRQSRAFQMLSIYGVPEERAKSVSNGIDVLMTRVGKEVRAIEQQLTLARDYLKRYGSHDSDCFQSIISSTKACCCGYDASLASAAEAGGKETTSE